MVGEEGVVVGMEEGGSHEGLLWLLVSERRESCVR